jgi:hypothetical protein
MKKLLALALFTPMAFAMPTDLADICENPVVLPAVVEYAEWKYAQPENITLDLLESRPGGSWKEKGKQLFKDVRTENDKIAMRLEEYLDVADYEVADRVLVKFVKINGSIQGDKEVEELCNVVYSAEQFRTYQARRVGQLNDVSYKIDQLVVNQPVTVHEHAQVKRAEIAKAEQERKAKEEAAIREEAKQEALRLEAEMAKKEAAARVAAEKARAKDLLEEEALKLTMELEQNYMVIENSAIEVEKLEQIRAELVEKLDLVNQGVEGAKNRADQASMNASGIKVVLKGLKAKLEKM